MITSVLRTRVKRFKKALRWRTEDEENSKFNGMDVLKYAIIARNYVVVKYYVDKILRETEPNSRERVARLSSPTTHPMIHTDSHVVGVWCSSVGVRALVLSQNNSIVSLSLVISINYKSSFKYFNRITFSCHLDHLRQVRSV